MQQGNLNTEGYTILTLRILHLITSQLASVMGPSGSGKSTLMNVLLGKIPKSDGQIFINNRPDKMKKYSRSIGFVPQVNHLVPTHSVGYSPLARRML